MVIFLSETLLLNNNSNAYTLCFLHVLVMYSHYKPGRAPVAITQILCLQTHLV